MGFSVSRQPAYMYQSPSGYIFRLRVPNDLKRVVDKWGCLLTPKNTTRHRTCASGGISKHAILCVSGS
jgi:hypothetical protein